MAKRKNKPGAGRPKLYFTTKSRRFQIPQLGDPEKQAEMIRKINAYIKTFNSND